MLKMNKLLMMTMVNRLKNKWKMNQKVQKIIYNKMLYNNEIRKHAGNKCITVYALFG